jgi:hypothetical protein
MLFASVNVRTLSKLRLIMNHAVRKLFASVSGVCKVHQLNYAELRYQPCSTQLPNKLDLGCYLLPLVGSIVNHVRRQLNWREPFQPRILGYSVHCRAENGTICKPSSLLPPCLVYCIRLIFHASTRDHKDRGHCFEGYILTRFYLLDINFYHCRIFQTQSIQALRRSPSTFYYNGCCRRRWRYRASWPYYCRSYHSNREARSQDL